MLTNRLASWLEQKMKRLAQEEKQESKRQKALERELEWVRMAPKARQAKSKARLSAYDKMASEESREKEQKLELYIPPGPRLGDVVLQFDGVSKKYGDRVLFENLNFNIIEEVIITQWVSIRTRTCNVYSRGYIIWIVCI